MLDATTAIEDKDFWVNPGFDPIGIVSAGLDTIAGQGRAAPRRSPSSSSAPASCPPEAFEGSTYERKVREIIQSIRLTEAYPGEEGKQQIITAYLNQNFYGNQSYGVKAAAKGYFGKTLEELTLAQYAILAAIPQSPTKFDLVRNAEEVCLDETSPRAQECDASSSSSCPQDSEIVQRRNYILDLMKTRSPLTGNKHTPAEYEAAKVEPVELTPAGLGRLEGARTSCGRSAASSARSSARTRPNDCPEVDTGGYRVITTPRLEHAADRREVGLRRGPRARTRRTRGRS